MVYVNYSDDGEHVLNGSETSINPFSLVHGEWLTNLRVGGQHEGSLQTLVISTQKSLYGSVQSTLDGVSYNGIPDAQCDPESLPAPQPGVHLDRLLEQLAVLLGVALVERGQDGLGTGHAGHEVDRGDAELLELVRDRLVDRFANVFNSINQAYMAALIANRFGEDE